MNPETNKKSDGPVLRPHIYDGIQEFDQKLPNWWLYTLYGAIVWFLLYWLLYYQFGMFRKDTDVLSEEVARVQTLKAQELEKLLSTLDDNALWEWSRNGAMTGEGKAVFESTCAVCHASDLSAVKDGVKLPGMPLNDKEWKYGGKPMDLWKMVSKGSPDKTQPIQMPPWEQQLSPGQIARVVAYVLSFHEKPTGTP